MDSNTDKEPPSLDKGKKSEMIELRISYEAKQALQKRAHQDGRSVSKIIRHLIYDFLTLDTEAHHMPKTNIHSKLKAFLYGWKGKFSAGAFALLALTSSVFLVTYAPANAAELSIMIDGKIKKELADQAINETTFTSEVHLDYNQSISFELGSPNNKTIAFDMIIKDLEDPENSQDDLVMIEIMLRDISNGQNTIIAKPRMSVFLGQNATVETGIEGAPGTKSYKLQLTPNLIK